MNLYRIICATYENVGPNVVTTKYTYYVCAKTVADCLLKLQKSCPYIEDKEDIIKIDKLGDTLDTDVFENIKL